jgi:O-antigen ligase
MTASTYEAAAPQTDYRRRIAIAIPAIMVAYGLLIWPLLYAKQFVSADVSATLGPVIVETPLNKFYYPALFILTAVIFLAERRWFVRGSGAVLTPLAAVLTLAALSFLWALDPSRAFNQALIVVLTTATVAMSSLVAGSVRRPLDAVFWVVMATMSINLFVVLATPAGPIGHEGIYTHKNALGSTVAIGVLFCLYGILCSQRHMRLAGALLLPACLFMLAASQSKTSFGLALFVPVVTATLVIGVRWFRVNLVVMIGLIAALGWATLALLNGFGITSEMVITAIFNDPTFTGRTDIWAFATEHIPDRLWLGHGFFSFWNIGDASPQLAAPAGFLRVTPHAHNGYLDILLHLGVIGLALFLWLLFAVAGHLSRLIRQMPSVGYAFVTLFLFYVLVNFLESTWFVSLNDPYWALFAYMIFAPLAPRRDTLETLV